MHYFKQLLSALLLVLSVQSVSAQDSAYAIPGNDTQVYVDPMVNDEAGGIDASEEPAPAEAGLPVNWIVLALGGLVIAVVASVITYAVTASSRKQSPVATAPAPEMKVSEEQPATETSDASLNQLQNELNQQAQELVKLRQTCKEQEQKLQVQAQFDAAYFSAVFRKLVTPLHEAMEQGSKKDLLEQMFKMSIHFTSLTRYKIAKRQPYDEANIHYMLNQRAGLPDSAVEITADTPADKIPAHMRPVLELLKENNSSGLDESVIAGCIIRKL
jgi:uncharacterized membrane protein YhiD involved in acid resistance